MSKAAKRTTTECPLRHLDAEAAEREVEELIWQVGHFEPGKQRMLFIFECGEPDIWPCAQRLRGSI